MSVHSSLRSGNVASGLFRNVMKRHERVRHLMAQGLWPEGRSVFGLPKIKQTKLKARKAAAKEKAEAPAKGAAPAASGASASA